MKRNLILTSIAATCCLGLAASPAGATTTAAVSENWAGYEATSDQGGFSAVSGGWVQPTANCSAGGSTYSAFWVGLGGGASGSSALEQIGTQSNCTSSGSAQYFAWYELVPAAPVQLSMKINPGDRMYARVSVSGTSVTLSLQDQTSGQSVTRDLTMTNPNPDTSTAEWIAEAPSACTSSQGQCTPLPLSDFGSVKFNSAYATSAGHTASISGWNAQPIALSPSSGTAYIGGGYGFGYGDPAAAAAGPSQAGAQPSSLSTDGASFSVAYGTDAGYSAGSGSGAGNGYGAPSGDPYGSTVPYGSSDPYGSGYPYGYGDPYGGGGYGYGYGPSSGYSGGYGVGGASGLYLYGY